ncbi:hypothetical protein [Streptomyces silvisoli]|uniref:Uncharacterized protein n=1 Tax=Streptomyces silvisoli TaxID=3034235 RepID=A0ABT5ZSD2_9ACTN|nr:hypothetical protein [Streptomyces silvisoli]MDF3292434.1 hypothetical protein [Streptomyces silvisoli]
MSVAQKPTSRDQVLEQAFGAPVTELYAQAVSPAAYAALQRALELRSFLALAEEQVARVRERVHDATAADRDMGELSADDLRMDAAWLEAALAGREGYAVALDDLLRTMPPVSEHSPRPAQFTQPKITATAPAPASVRAGAAPARRP